jgi:thiol-disulfide isomerase/thioredoxin
MLIRLTAGLVLLTLIATASARQEASLSDPHAFPANRAVIEAMEMDIRDDPEVAELYDSFEAIVAGYEMLVADLVTGRPVNEPGAATRLRRVADFAGQIVIRFPEHERSILFLNNRWQALSFHEPKVAFREMRVFFDLGGEAGDFAPLLYGQEISLSLQADASDAALGEPPQLTRTLEVVDRRASAGEEDSAASVLVSAGRHLARREEIDGARKLFERAVREFPDAAPTASARGILRRFDAVGQPFELSFTDVHTGKPVDSQNDLAGKVLLIDFWATWCGPCLADTPNLLALHEEFADRGFEIVGVSVDFKRDALVSYLAENELPWPQHHAHGPEGIAAKWGVYSYPTYFLVGRDGTILDADVQRDETRRTAIIRALAEPAPEM